MRNRFLTLAMALAASVLQVSGASAEDAHRSGHNQYATIIAVSVQAEAGLHEAVKDKVIAELRRNDDVRISDEAPIFGFKVMVSKLRHPLNKKTILGYAAALVVERYPGKAFVREVNELLAQSMDGGAYQELTHELLQKGIFHFGFQKTAPKDGLEELLVELVKAFEHKVLIPDRERYKQLEEEAKSLGL